MVDPYLPVKTTYADEVNSVADASGQLSVSEIFGPTWQGEGSSIGKRCYFLRLGGCNQHCVWCDTPYTWDWTGRNGTVYDPKRELRKFSVDDLLAELALLMPDWELEVSQRAYLSKMLVISGGEPMLQQKRLVPLARELRRTGWRIEIETAGTIFPLPELAPFIDQFNVSPKLENSGNDLKTRYKGKVLEALQETGRVCWKFVVMDRADLSEIRHIVTEHRLSPVYIMPEGKTEDAIHGHMKDIAAAVLEEGWNLTSRLQVELWGNRRGV